MNKAFTWNEWDKTPTDYTDQWVYRTETIWGTIYGNIEYARIALENGLEVTPEPAPNFARSA